MTERAEEVWQLFKGGFLNAFSVGFIPLKGHRPTPDDIKKNPDLAEARFIYDEWELLEFSPVTVPANPEALSQAIKSHDIMLSKGMRECLNIEVIQKVDIETDETEVVKVCIPVKEIQPQKKKISVSPIFGLTDKK
jgi:phage head maturation protease